MLKASVSENCSVPVISVYVVKGLMTQDTFRLARQLTHMVLLLALSGLLIRLWCVPDLPVLLHFCTYSQRRGIRCVARCEYSENRSLFYFHENPVGNIRGHSESVIFCFCYLQGLYNFLQCGCEGDNTFSAGPDAPPTWSLDARCRDW